MAGARGKEGFNLRVVRACPQDSRDLGILGSDTRRCHRGGCDVPHSSPGIFIASVTGVSAASAAAFSRIAYPEMKKLGYKKEFAVGAVAGSACLSMLIPPSVLLIVWALLTEMSVGALFIPGLLLAFLFTAWCVLAAVINPEIAPAAEPLADFEKSDRSEIIGAFGILALRYLALREEGRLLPASLAGRAQVDQWLAFVDTTLMPPFIGAFWQLVRTPETQRNAARIGEHGKALEAALGILDASLQKHPWLSGSTFGIADIAAGTPLFRVSDLGLLPQSLPGIAQWYGKFRDRKGFCRHVAVSYDELKVG